MILEVLNPEKWFSFMSVAYPLVFGEHRNPSDEKVDFVLITKNEEKVHGFVTCKIMDSETVYWQFGGAMLGTKGTLAVINSYLMFINYCREKYKRITTRIENNNIPMIRLALKCGFLVQGVWIFKGKTYLECCLEF